MVNLIIFSTVKKFNLTNPFPIMRNKAKEIQIKLDTNLGTGAGEKNRLKT
jgi:hypothetical protein